MGHEQPCPQNTSLVASSHGQTSAGYEQAGADQGFQQQVRAQLQVIEHKLDSIVYRLTSAAELQLPRRESSLQCCSSFPRVLVGAPGVGVTGEESLQPHPMLPAEPRERSFQGRSLFACVMPGVPEGSWQPSPSPPPPAVEENFRPPSMSPAEPLPATTPPHVKTKTKSMQSLLPSLFQHRPSNPIKPVTNEVPVPSLEMRVLHWLKERLGLGRLQSSRDMAMKRCKERKLWRLVHSMPFQVVISLVIMLNALFIGLSVEAELSAFTRKEDLDKKWAYADIFFCVVFFLELFLRAISERWLFFYGEDYMWNLFDAVLVATSIVDTVLNNHGSVGMVNLGAARVFRFMRFVRLIRLVRAARAIQSLRHFILSMSAAGMPLFWCALMLSIFVYFFALCFLNGVTEYLRDGASNVEEKATVLQMYGNVWLAMTTLFMCISGGMDWQDAMEPLVNVHWAYAPVFVCFIFFMFFGVLNIVVGSFVTAATEISKKDRELLVNAELESWDEYTKRVKEFFADADQDMSGKLSWQEFENHLKNPQVSAYFASLELDVSNAHRLFRIMDTDCSNMVGLDEFLDGCRRLKGQASSIDVNMLVYEIERISRQISHIIEKPPGLWVSSRCTENAETHKTRPQ